MKVTWILGGIAALIVLLIGADGVYQVNETQQVIITQFGDPVGPPVVQPGLHFKLPLVQVANYFEKRYMEWDGDPNRIPTRDKRFIWVNTYARWRIADPLKYFQRLKTESQAQSRLDDILDGETRNSIAKHDLREVVRNSNRDPGEVVVDTDDETAILEPIEKGRSAIRAEILSEAAVRVQDLGIEILDLQLKRINYVDEVQKDVFERMIAERQRIAARYVSEGQGESARIRGEKERELQRIQSEAYRKAETIRGEADAQATSIYADAYNRDPDFYSFLKSMELYEASADAGTYMIMTTDADFLKYLKNQNPR